MEDFPGGPVCMREAIQRELEKEMIREKIIAEEVERYHVLEAEVRRELMLGRQMMALMSKMGPSSSYLPTTLSEAEQKQQPSLHYTQLNSSSQKKNLKWSCPVCKVTATCEHGFMLHLAGKKHKAKVEALKAHNSEKTTNNSFKWTCPICEVNATCESGLLEHLTGKKHKVNIECLRADNNGETYKKSVEIHEPLVCVPNDSQEDEKKKVEWGCPICKVIAKSEVNFQSHLEGKKHKAKVVTITKGKNI